MNNYILPTTVSHNGERLAINTKTGAVSQYVDAAEGWETLPHAEQLAAAVGVLTVGGKPVLDASNE